MSVSQFVLVNNETNQEYPLEGTINIGRSNDNDFILDDTSVSRYHGRIDCTDDGLVVKDLDSTNGTFVNGKRIKQLEINKECRLQFGDVKCRIQIGEKTLIFNKGANKGDYNEEKAPPKAKSKKKSKPKVGLRSVLGQHYFHKQLKECVLEPLNEGLEQYNFPVNSISTIGRLNLNDVFLDNKLVSRNHAMIEVRSHEVVLSDSNSANGTFVNEERIARKVLANGDIVGITGELTFKVLIDIDETQSENSLRIEPDCSFVDVVQDTNILMELFRAEFGEQILLEVERQTILFYTEFENYIKGKNKGNQSSTLDELKHFIKLISKAAAIQEPAELTGRLSDAVSQIIAAKQSSRVAFFEVPDVDDNSIMEANGLLISFPNSARLVIYDIPYENFFYLVFAAGWLSQLTVSSS